MRPHHVLHPAPPKREVERRFLGECSRLELATGLTADAIADAIEFTYQKLDVIDQQTRDTGASPLVGLVDLPELSALCAELLSDDASFMLLNAYAERISGAALSSLMYANAPTRGGTIDWGELTLVEEAGDRQIGMSFYGRWSA